MDSEQKTEINEIISKIQELLNEEKWTRAALENYTKNNFLELDDYIKKALEQGIEDELYDLCLVHLSHSQKSVNALYIAGMISLLEDAFDLSALYKVINRFREYKKYNIVEYLAEKILEKGDDKYVLNTLKDIYELSGNTEELHKIWERIVKIDYDNGEIANKLAHLRLEEDNEEEAIYYFKITLKRFSRKHNINIVKEIWETLLNYIPLDLEFFYLIEKEIVKYDEKEAAELLKLNVDYAINKDKVELAIELLTKILIYNPKDKESRNKLADCFKIKYKNHSQLNECLKSSSLNQTWKNFQQALDEFQRRIAFDVDNYVYHRHWGIGKIIQLIETHMFIDFDKKKNHKMSSQMALSSLRVLPSDHIWIQKQHNIETLQDDSPEGIEKTLKIVLKSLNNEASRKDIKAELVPDIVSTKNWTKWWTKAKKIIKTSSVIGQSPTKKDYYSLRENPLTYEEESLKNFQNVTNFDDKFNIFIDYYETSKDEGSDTLLEMLEYFTEVCNKSEILDDKAVKSFILLRKIRKEIPNISVDIQLNPNQLREIDIESLMFIYNKIDNQDFKKLFLKRLKKERNDWDLVYESFIANTSVSKANNVMIDELLTNGKEDRIKKIFNEIFSNQRTNLEEYLWSIKLLFSNEELGKLINIDEESVLLNLIRLLDIINKDIENKKNITFNKKMHSQITELVTKEDRIKKLVNKMKEENRKEDCEKLAVIVRGTISLKEKTKSKLLEYVYNAYPDLEKVYEEKKEDTNDLIVTRKSYERKQKEYQNIVNVEIPQNSKDIGKAQEKGDLRENSEYQMALERQKQLQSIAAKLDKELGRAKILYLDKVDTSKINIGTKVTLLNLQSKKQETYSLLGEWDSDIEKGIISYMSPLGQALLGSQLTEVISFTHEGNKRKYKVLKIKKVNFPS